MAAFLFMHFYADRLRRQSLLRRRIFRTSEDPFRQTNEDFIKLFRLRKEDVREICEEIREDLTPMSGVSTALSVETKVLCALRFYATGSYQRSVGQDLMLAISQSSVSNSIAQVSKAIKEKMLHRVTFPYPSDYATLKLEFFHMSRFPGVIGAVDCTHIAIIAPPETDELYPEQAYINRKGFHSINVQLVCDTNMKILNVNTKYPGRTHDSFIWRNSKLREILQEENSDQNHPQGWLVGDSGYPLEPWLMTPVSQPVNSAESEYNKCHSKARCVIERCNGLLKSRFRCLLRHRVLHYHPTAASDIISACVVLHNICIERELPFQDDVDVAEDREDINLTDVPVSNVQISGEGVLIRNNIIRSCFS